LGLGNRSQDLLACGNNKCFSRCVISEQDLKINFLQDKCNAVSITRAVTVTVEPEEVKKYVKHHLCLLPVSYCFLECIEI
jgi:hypothetical protein